MDAEVKRLINILRTAMRILGVSNREVERRLGMSPSYLTRVFSGGIELKVDHLIQVTRAIGMEPAEFFQLAYPKRTTQGSKAADNLQDALRDLQAPPPEPPPPPPEPKFREEDMERLLLTTLRKLMGDGVKGESKK